MTIFSGIKSKFLSIIGAFVLTMGASVLLTLNTVRTQTHDLASIDLVVRLRLTTVEVLNETQELIAVLESESSSDEVKKRLLAKMLKVKRQLHALEQGGQVTDSEGRELILKSAKGKAQLQLKNALENWQRFQLLINVFTREGVDIASDEFFNASTSLDQYYQKVLKSISKTIPLLKEATEKNIVLLKQIITAALCITILVAILVWLYARNQIVSPVLECLEMISDLERGSPVQLKMTRTDEIGQLARGLDAFSDSLQGEILKAFNCLANGNFTFEASGVIREPLEKANNTLTSILLNILELSHQLDLQSRQVSESSAILAQGASEQATTLEQLSSSQQEIARQTLQNANNAKEASMYSANAQKAAEEGNIQMQKMLVSLEEITGASKNISRIIEVINDIAFQSNILALNASVEAARAGKYGKGFAVVASEVRSLAVRTSDASNEIAGLIESTVSMNREGAKIAKQSAAALKINVQEVTKGSELIAEINVASNEQTKGIDYINQALSQIEEVTNANACTAEKTATMAKQLSTHSTRLRQMLSRFQLRSRPKIT